MKIKMTNLYGLEGTEAYYRENGDCFDFVNRAEFASELTEEKVAKVMNSADWYCKQYGASALEIVQ